MRYILLLPNRVLCVAKPIMINTNKARCYKIIGLSLLFDLICIRSPNALRDGLGVGFVHLSSQTVKWILSSTVKIEFRISSLLSSPNPSRRVAPISLPVCKRMPLSPFFPYIMNPFPFRPRLFSLVGVLFLFDARVYNYVQRYC